MSKAPYFLKGNMYKKGDKIVVVYVEPSDMIKIGKEGVVVKFDKSDKTYEIDWGGGWTGWMKPEHIHRIGDPDKFDFVDLHITRHGKKEYKGVLTFKHHNVLKKIKNTQSCPYNVTKDLVSKFKHDPLKYV